MKLTINGVEYPMHVRSGAITEFTQTSPTAISSGAFMPGSTSFTRVGVIGTFTAGSRRRNNTVFFFKLPDFHNDPNAIVSANLAIDVLDVTDNPTFSLDLWGRRATISDYGSDNGIIDPNWRLFGVNDSQSFTILSTGFIGPNSIGTVTLPAEGRNALIAFLQSIYADGAQAGQLVAFRLNPDMDISATDSGTWGYVIGFIEPEEKDTDGDGLLDAWEIEGYPPGAAGQDGFVDLPAMGADPLHKDIFVEIDCSDEMCPDHSAMNAVIEVFARAPNRLVRNPDQQDGINIHIDAGPNYVMKRNSDGNTVTWGSALSGGGDTIVPHIGANDQTTYAQQMRQIASDFMHPNRRPIFHYGLFVERFTAAAHHDRLCTSIELKNSSGIQVPNSQIFLVAMKSKDGVEPFNYPTLPQAIQASTFMHELGHTLGLHHGGYNDNINYKPNYFSVMNYAFQFQTLEKRISARPEVRSIDYSLYEQPVLHESQLDETKGLSAPIAEENYTFTYFFCPAPSPNQEPDKVVVNTLDREIDWNCSGHPFDTLVTDANINKDTDPFTECSEIISDNLVAPTDWDRLVYDIGLIGGRAGNSFVDVVSNVINENDTGEELIVPNLGSYIHAPRSVFVTDQVIIPVNVRNFGLSDDSYEISAAARYHADGVSVDRDDVTLASGESESFMVTYTPSDSPIRDWDLLTIVARSSANPTIKSTTEVNIALPLPIAPLADAGPDQRINEGLTVTLDGSASSDADGTIVIHQWSQTAGPDVVLSGANASIATFLTPQVLSTTVLNFELTVTDDDGLATSDTIAITVDDIRASQETTSSGGGAFDVLVMILLALVKTVRVLKSYRVFTKKNDFASPSKFALGSLKSMNNQFYANF